MVGCELSSEESLPVTAILLGVLGVFLFSLSGCRLLEKPRILRVHPDKGVPGTVVIIEGLNLGDPRSDSELPRLYLGDQTLCYDPQNPSCPVQEWTPTQIRWVVPFYEPGSYPLYVVTERGESNRVPFELLEVELFRVNAYVVGILDQGSEAVQFLRLQVNDSEIQVVPWDLPTAEVTEAESVPTYSLSLSHPGMKINLEDLLLRPNGESYVLISATPTDPALTDGIHGFYDYSQNFTTPQGFVTTSTFPRLFLPFERWGVLTFPFRFGVYAEGGRILTFFEEPTGGVVHPLSEFSLLFLGLDFQPLGFFPILKPSPSLLLSGKYSATGTGAIHWLVPRFDRSRIPEALEVTSTIGVGEGVQPLLPSLSPSGGTLYVLHRKPNRDAVASYGVRVYELAFSGELTLPAGWKVEDLRADSSGLWLLTSVPATTTGYLLYLNPELFPRESTEYTLWKASITTQTGPNLSSGITAYAEIPVTSPVTFDFLPGPGEGTILLLTREGNLYRFPLVPPYREENLRLLRAGVALEPKRIRTTPVVQ
jgi:hypothetical protein